MAGHSKWANIQHKKGAADAKRGKVFGKHSKKITIAAREGGDPDFNPSLRLAIDNAKADNMPNDNIDRAIKKGSGAGGGEDMKEIVYEGYAPAGVAVLVHTVTDNHNRTGAEIRHTFSKYNGNMGSIGSVSYLFEKKGIVEIECNDDTRAEELELQAIELDAIDVSRDTEAGVLYLYFPADKTSDAKKALEDSGVVITRSEVSLQPKDLLEVSEEDQVKVLKLLEALDDNDDVTEVATNLG